MSGESSAPEEVVIVQPRGQPGAGSGADLGATRLEVDLDRASPGIAPLAQAADGLLKQGKRFIALDLGRFATLKADELKALVDMRERCAKAGGSLTVFGVQKDVAQTLKTLGLDKTLDAAPDARAAVEGVRRRVDSQKGRDLQVDVHVLPLGKKKGDEAFLDGFRRKGPEGLTREIVVLEVDEKGVQKLGEKVRQLADKKLTACVVDLSQVATLDGAAVKEIQRAKKIAEERGGYLSLAGAREAVAGLLKVMSVDREVPTHGTREKAIDEWKGQLLAQIEAAGEKRRGAGGESARFAEAPAPDKAGEAAAAVAPAVQAVETRGGEMKGPQEANAEPRLSLERGGNELFFYEKGKKPAKKDLAGDTPFLSLYVKAETISALAGEVGRAISAGRNRIVVDLSALASLDATAIEALKQAAANAKERSARVVFAAGSESVRKAASGLEVFADEGAAAEQLAVEILEQKSKKGVKFNRIRSEVDPSGGKKTGERAGVQSGRSGKTAMISAPKFDEDDDAPPAKPEEKKGAKTAMIAAPNFDDDDDAPPATKAPEKKADEKKGAKTAMIAAPTFDDDDDAPPAKPEEKKGAKTAMIAAPNFDDDDDAPAATKAPEKKEDAKKPEEKKGARTAMIAAPTFDDDDAPPAKPPEEKKGAKTAMIAAPSFDDDDDAPAKTAAPAKGADEKKGAKTAMIAAPSFDDDDDAPSSAAAAPTKSAPAPAAAPAPAPAAPAKAGAPAPAPAAASPAPAAATPASPAPAPAAAATPPPPPKEDLKGKKTEMIQSPPPMKPDEMKGKKTEMIQSPAAGPPPVIGAKSGEMKAAKTEMMAGLSKEDALRLAREAAGGAPAGKPPAAPAQDLKGKKTEMIQSPPPMKPDEMKGKKTEMIQSPAGPPPVAPPPVTAAKSGEMKAAKTEMMAGLSKEDALRLAKEAAGGGPAGKPPAAPAQDLKGKKTEMIQSPPPAKPEEIKGKKTEMIQSPAAPPPPVTTSGKTGEMKAAKTEMMGGLSKEDALRIAKEAAGGGAPAKADDLKGKKTEMIQSPPPAKPEDMKGKKTEMIQSPATPPPLKPKTGEMQVQSTKTEAMPGLSKEDALRLAKEAAGGAKPEELKGKKTEMIQSPAAPKPPDLAAKKTGPMAIPQDAAKRDVQGQKTEMMAGLSKEEAMKKAKEEAAGPGPGKAAAPVAQEGKTQAMPGLTAADAKKLAGGGAPAPARPAPAQEPKRSAMPLFAAAAVALIVAVGLIGKTQGWFGPKAPEVAGSTTGGTSGGTPKGTTGGTAGGTTGAHPAATTGGTSGGTTATAPGTTGGSSSTQVASTTGGSSTASGTTTASGTSGGSTAVAGSTTGGTTGETTGTTVASATPNAAPLPAAVKPAEAPKAIMDASNDAIELDDSTQPAGR